MEKKTTFLFVKSVAKKSEKKGENMNKVTPDENLRELGWYYLTGNPDPSILWYGFFGGHVPENLNVEDKEVQDYGSAFVCLIRDMHADVPDELQPFWSLSYQSIDPDNSLSFDELEAFYLKLKSLRDYYFRAKKRKRTMERKKHEQTPT